MKAVLYFPDYTFDISDINEDMEQSSAVNPVEPDADFYIGVSSKSELKFSLNNLYQLISENSFANKEFLLQRGKPTEYNNVFDVYKKIRKPLFIQQGGFTFAANDRKPYLSIYNSDLVFQNAPAQPSQPVKSLFIVGSKLYCVHDKEPYLTAYAVSSGILTLQPQVTLTGFYQNKLMGYAKNGRCFNKQGNIVIEYVSIYADMKISDVISETWEYKNFGYYIVLTAEKINDTKISVIAYDRMKKFEVVADEFIDSVTYPISLKSLLTKLCAFVGVSFKNRALLNENYSVARNFKTEGVTCRQVLQWISQITANFAYIDFDGNLNISWYTEMDSQINASNSTVIDIADYVVQPIDKVQARAFESDIGVIVPIDERKPNAYIIENNPLLYANSDAQIRPAITNIYNAIKKFSYIPFTAKTYVVDENIKAGADIPIKTIKGKNFSAYIMQSTLKGVKGLSAEYAATGNEYRKTQVDAVNQAIKMLNGRTNSIIATIDEFSVTLDEIKDTGEQNTAQLKVQAGQITTEVKRATTAEGKLSENISTVKQTADGLTVTVQGQGGKISSLEQTVSGFKLAVDNSKLTFDATGLTIKNGGFRIYDEFEKEIFSISEGGFGVKMFGSVKATDNETGSGVSLSSHGVDFYDSLGETIASLSIYRHPTLGDSLSISSDRVWISGRVPSLTVGALYLFADSADDGDLIGKATYTFPSGEKIYPLIWRR